MVETSLHRQLKALYDDGRGAFEVPVDGFRIDVVAENRLVEIQHAPLAAIRRKVAQLLARHDVLVVKPIVIRKRLFKRRRRGGTVKVARMSPKRGSPLDLFHELVHFTEVFPHERLTLDVALVDVEEWRYPAGGRRVRHRDSDYHVEDRKLLEVHKVYRLREAADLRQLIPVELPSPFDTVQLADALGIERWWAQRIAYCFRKMGTARLMGKRRGALLYEFTSKREAA